MVSLTFHKKLLLLLLSSYFKESWTWRKIGLGERLTLLQIFKFYCTNPPKMSIIIYFSDKSTRTGNLHLSSLDKIRCQQPRIRVFLSNYKRRCSNNQQHLSIFLSLSLFLSLSSSLSLPLSLSLLSLSIYLHRIMPQDQNSGSSSAPTVETHFPTNTQPVETNMS